MDLWKIAMDLVNQEEQARQIAKHIKQYLKRIVIPEELKLKFPHPFSVIDNKRNYTVTGSYGFSVKGIGTLTEMSLLSPSSDFDIKIVWDGFEFKDSFTGFSAFSLYIDELMAFDRHGRYIFGFKNLSFLTSFSLRIFVPEAITFEKIYIKADMLKMV